MIPQQGPGLLTGIRVLDLTRVLAGPFATSLLADMGADVIKVEHPTDAVKARRGEPAVGGIYAHFLNLNRNKRSIGLDLALPRGKSLFLSLVEQVDVVVENFRPGVMDRLGLDYPTLAKRNEQIIMCSISGFGQTGGLREKPAYDVIVQAMSGAMSVTGESGRDPVRLGIPMGDLSGALFGTIGILTALYDRTATGRGQHIDVSMLDGLTNLMIYYPTDYLNSGRVAGPVGGRHIHAAPYGILAVKDGYIVIAVLTREFWELFCNAIEHPELLEDERFETAEKRLKNKDALYPILEDVLHDRTQSEWSAVFDAAGVPNAPVLRVDQMAQHPIMRDREMFVETIHPKAGHVFVPGRAIKFPDREPFTVRIGAPSPGEHGDEVLRELLGTSPEEVESLRDDGVML